MSDAATPEEPEETTASGSPEEAKPRARLGAPDPPPPPRRGFRGFWIILSVTLGLSGGLLALILSADPEPFEKDIEAAQRFVDGLIMATAPNPDDDDRPGYAMSYQLLTPRLRDEVGYAAFVDEFDRYVEQYGQIESSRAQRRMGRGGRRRNLAYTLRYSGTQGRPEQVRLALVIAYVDDQYRVDSYRLEVIKEKN